MFRHFCSKKLQTNISEECWNPCDRQCLLMNEPGWTKCRRSSNSSVVVYLVCIVDIADSSLTEVGSSPFLQSRMQWVVVCLLCRILLFKIYWSIVTSLECCISILGKLTRSRSIVPKSLWPFRPPCSKGHMPSEYGRYLFEQPQQPCVCKKRHSM